MTIPSPKPDDLQDRFNEVLTGYFEAAESGADVDQTALLAANPEFAVELSEFLSTVEQVDRYTGAVRRVVSRVTPEIFPQSFGDYELLAQIGSGGMGVVYQARQTSLSRLVAVKLIRGGTPVSGLEGKRFRSEAEAAAHLEHPGIVPIYEIGEHEGRPFFSMKLFEGGSLAARIPEYQADPRRAAALVATIARAVHHAHQRGILHRDLKPSNILLDSEGRPHVADFSLAKWLEVDQVQTQTGIIIGTPAYMAPEQASPIQESGVRSVVTSASDVYGLGAILYALLAGKPPFQGVTPLDTLLAVRENEPVGPTKINPLVDRDLETICLKCLEKDPGRRYGSALALAEDLDRWQAGHAILARPISGRERARRWCKKNPLLAAMTASAALLLIFGVVTLATGYVLLSQSHDRAETHRRDAEEHASSLRQRLYASQMTLGFKLWERGDLDELSELLIQFQNDRDLVGFEWHWLNAQARINPREVVRFTGHQHIVYGATYSADGKTVASCAADRSIQIWDAATGALRTLLLPGPATASEPVKDQAGDENCVSFSPDGKSLASGCEDGSVRLWNLATETWRPLVPAHQGEVLSIQFSRDGRWLVSAGADKIIRMWDMSALGTSVEFGGHLAPVQCVVLSSDGQRLASVGRDGGICVWDRQSQKVLLSFSAGECAYSVALSPDGSQLATGACNGAVRLWNAANGVLIRNLGQHQGGVRSLDFSPDGRRLASCGEFGHVQVVSLDDGQVLFHFKAHRDRIWCIRFDPDGRQLLTTSADLTARIWKLSNPVQSTRWFAASTVLPRQLAFSSRGHSLAVVSIDGQILIGDAVKREPLEIIVADATNCCAPAFSPDGTEMAFVGLGGILRRCLVDQKHELPDFNPSPVVIDDFPVVINDLRWAPEWVRLSFAKENCLVALRFDGRLSVCDGQRWVQRHLNLQSRREPPLLALLPDGKTIAICDEKRSMIQFWNLDKERAVREIPYSTLGIADCSPDGKIVAFGCGNGRVSIIELATGNERLLPVGHRLNVTSIRFSPDGRTLASASDDGTVRLWHVSTGQEMFVLEDRRGKRVFAIAFSQDGRLFAIGGDAFENGGTVTVYDVSPPK